ncbi:MAG: aminodeoxychorismate/anthranilate synthase component II [Cenarchaeum sp. SB0665_bin_23]|nr:aminodeoxychorismate/anthranilate synthase component II [Cenarchaeum sp. SB0667_bin_13]MXY61214.1 aminodeoxychorismate/anthranilate synthase component II [Cenarchaeum sp. SB0665_bin_23]MXZ93925.1 aminodeoxychorismate/anthranilate synthase component II [Cenarchaeum sp. SB0666_bin_15]MYB46880.1 aminodeoxychorismate/anthranilate synthase component II [Cenarchaeum sp. SB0662_bin_33]MYC80004.1 aminodeoxychorismate/anthranilate synthase component II [Cenarchaeum sp. SB0661_bin_35]MYD59376.1 amino
MNILIIDNYDSFVYNIAQYVGSVGAECQVVRNDTVDMEAVSHGTYDGIIISPGPGTPSERRYFGACSDIIKKYSRTIPTLGVCLGHQGIIEAYGGVVTNAGHVMHGKTSLVKHDGMGIFEGLPSPLRATRYHSLVGEKTTIPPCLEVTATAQDDGEVMAVRHRSHPVIGVQFHPESIMTECGIDMIRNFLRGI